MKTTPGIILATLTLAATAYSQSANYQITAFGAPHVNKAGGERSDTRSIAVDGKGSILVFRRSSPHVLIFNRQGELQKAWGEGLFTDSHNIDVDHEGFVWLGDRNNQMVYKYTIDGRQLLALGTKGVTGNDTSRAAFNRPSDVAVAPNGDIFVADGYNNHRIVHFSKDGTFIKVIGGIEGKGPGQLHGVHGVKLDSKGRLLVLDGHDDNPRIQIFGQDGKFIEAWPALGLTMGSGFAIDNNDTVYVGDTDGEKIIVVKAGRIVETISGLGARPHNIAWDPGDGAIYLADTGALGGGAKKIVRK